MRDAARLEQLVKRQADRTPGAPAVRDGSTTTSYAELLGQARRVARVLRARGIRRHDLVAVCADRSTDQIVGVLGILLAGAAYVPIDPRGPTERRRFMLEDSQPRAIVTSAAFVGSFPAEHRNIIEVIETVAHEHLDGAGDGWLPSIGTPQDVAYVIYTSGSTGTPKGVLNQHDGISNHLAWMAEAFPLSTDDRVLAKTPAVFDVSVWEWFWPLSQGACLVLARPEGEKDPVYVLDAIDAYGITNVHFVPTLLRLFLERPDLDRCRSLQRVVCSGEALTAELRDRFFERMAGPPALINLYGPTEAAVHVTGWVCTPGETGPVPIGRPLPNVRTYIVDKDLNPVAEGVRGELLLGGVQVARGYLRRPELTSERFVPDPFTDDPTARCYRTGDCVSWRADGVIDFFGRYDAQVQLGGVRVELGEIEAALRLHPAVGDAAVVVRETEASKRIVAYLRRADRGSVHPDPQVDSLRRFLATRLADYMTPGWYVWLDEFPVTPTGKLDRGALPIPGVVRPSLEQEFEAPRPGIERRLARLWRAELQIDRIGRHDDFHLLGGDSLSAILLCEAIGREFGRMPPPHELLRSPTIALLASRLAVGQESSPPSLTIVTLRAGDCLQPLYLPPSMGGDLGVWRDFVEALGPERPVYGLAFPPDAVDSSDLPALAAALVRELVTFQPEGPYHLAGYSFSAAIAFEMAQQLLASGREVGVLAMIDYGPGAPDSWDERFRTVGHFINNLPRWLWYDILQSDWGSVAARAGRKLTSLVGKMVQPGRSDTMQDATFAAREMFDHLELPAAHTELIIDHLDAFYRYQPVAYDGRVLLFWARCRPLFHSLAPALGWEHYAAHGFDRVIVSCNHDNILKSPHVREIASRLDRAIKDQEPDPSEELRRNVG